MKPSGTIRRLLAASLFVMLFNNAAGQASDPDRRYLNEVFDDHVRTADIVFAEKYNDTTQEREKLTMRVFEPADDAETQRPLLILTPGGGFVAHEDHWMDEYGEQLARAGYVVAVNRYRLSGSIAGTEKFMNALFKAFFDQKAVIRYFVKDAQDENRFRVDPGNIFIGGHSAGAITSLHVAYLDAGDEISDVMTEALKQHGGINGNNGEKVDYRIRGVINLSGLVTDLDMIDTDEPPLMSLHGDRDSVVRIGATDDGLYGSIPIHRRADSVGLDNELHVIKGALHNDPADPRLCPECIPLTRRFMFNTIKRDSEKD